MGRERSVHGLIWPLLLLASALVLLGLVGAVVDVRGGSWGLGLGAGLVAFGMVVQRPDEGVETTRPEAPWSALSERQQAAILAITREGPDGKPHGAAEEAIEKMAQLTAGAGPTVETRAVSAHMAEICDALADGARDLRDAFGLDALDGVTPLKTSTLETSPDPVHPSGRPPRVYVASSWRNTKQPEVVEALREAGAEVYDFRHPEPGNNGFSWAHVDPGWKPGATTRPPEAFIEALGHPIAREGFRLDMDALRGADVTVLVMPCGRSAHLETGFAVGDGQRVAILLAEGGQEPELMYAMADLITSSLADITRYVMSAGPGRRPNHHRERLKALHVPEVAAHPTMMGLAGGGAPSDAFGKEDSNA